MSKQAVFNKALSILISTTCPLIFVSDCISSNESTENQNLMGTTSIDQAERE